MSNMPDECTQAIIDVLRNTDLFPVNPNRFYDIQEIYAMVDDNVEDDFGKTPKDFHHRIRGTICNYFNNESTIIGRKLERQELKPKEPNSTQVHYIYAFLENEPAK